MGNSKLLGCGDGFCSPIVDSAEKEDLEKAMDKVKTMGMPVVLNMPSPKGFKPLTADTNATADKVQSLGCGDGFCSPIF